MIAEQVRLSASILHIGSTNNRCGGLPILPGLFSWLQSRDTRPQNRLEYDIRYASLRFCRSELTLIEAGEYKGTEYSELRFESYNALLIARVAHSLLYIYDS